MRVKKKLGATVLKIKLRTQNKQKFLYLQLILQVATI